MSISEDTDQIEIPVDADIAARLEAFRREPSDADAYASLSGILRQAGRLRELAEVHELHAAHLQAAQAATAWTEAARARLSATQRERAEEDLGRALDADPAHEDAAGLLAELYGDAGRQAEAAELFENELAALKAQAEALPERKRAPINTRRGERHRHLAALWERELGRVDRALEHWQRAWHLEPERTDAIEAARNIYASLGDDSMVARLYEAQLEVMRKGGDDKARGQLELALGRIRAREGRMDDAATHLEEALRLLPGLDEALEALAEVYTSAASAERAEHRERACTLLLELGKRRLASASEPADEEAGIAYLRRALGVQPGSRQATDALASALREGERWEDLDHLYEHFLDQQDDKDSPQARAQRIDILGKRAELYDRYLVGRDTLRGLLVELSGLTPPHDEMSQKLRAFYRQEKDWSALAQHIERELPALAQEPMRAAAEMLELATIVREHLGDRDRAAAILHHILREIDPNHQEALARYGDHFRERRDWRGLADLLEFSVDSARKAGAPPPTLARQLEEIAGIAEQRLGDIERAIHTWRRIHELEPQSPRPGEEVRRLESRAKMWASLVGVLEHEAQSAQTPQKRAEALRRIAQVYRERNVNPRRAIALYEEVAGIFPDDHTALKALAELYEREGDQAGLAHTLRRRLDYDVRAMAAQHPGETPSVRDWPTAKRVERLTSLRRLVTMYEGLSDIEGVIYACTGVLDAIPGDRDALERLERALDKSGDVERLEQTLVYHVSAASGPAEKARVLRRLARIAADKQDDLAAMQRWEEVLGTVPNDFEAIETLADLYERHGRWADMARVLERGLLSQRSRAGTNSGIRRMLTQDGGGRYTTGEIRIGTGLILDPKKRLAQLLRYARVVDEKLGDAARSTRAWKEILELSPGHHQALEALARLHEQAGRWRDLVDVLAARIPLVRKDEPELAAQLALQRARLLEERIGAPGEAIKALEEMIREIAPGHLDAHRALRRLYEARGDFEAAVRTAERELYLSRDPDDKLARGLEIGRLCRDQLHDPTRAIQAFERVLYLKGDHEVALVAAVDLYARVEDWPSHVRTLEALVAQASEGQTRADLMTRIAQVTAERLDDRAGAFSWYRRAHEQAPRPQTLAALRRAAEAYELWSELAEVYEGERGRYVNERDEPTNPVAYVAACRELAALAERRLDAPVRAMNVLLDAILVAPLDEGLLSEAERIAAQADQRPLWQILLECQSAALERSSRARRVILHRSRARVLEERLDDPETALEELLKAFAWAPDQLGIRQSLYELAERSGSFTDVIAVESALLERAPSTHARLSILRRKAAVIEDKLHETVRAFRTHLSAFLLQPEDSDTVAHLWRLGRIIGVSYADADRTPRAEPPPAYVHPPEPAQSPRPRPAASGSSAEVPIDDFADAADEFRSNPTQELSVNDLSELMMSPADSDEFAESGRGSTIQLDLDEIVIQEEEEARRRDPTIELRTEDLISALREPSGKRPAPPPLPGVSARARKPPPPPSAAPPANPAPRRGKLPPLPSMPVRAYEGPWDELAAAYDLLPAADKKAKMRWLFRAAEVWENGAGDISRAFNTLARALELGVDDTEPRARLQRVASEHDSWDRLADLYESAAEDAKTADTAVGLLMEVAEIRARQKRSRETEALYRRVLGMRPRDRTARERLEGLYRSEGRWVDLAASLEERTDPRVGIAVPESERPELLRELADIYRRMSRPHDAIDALLRMRDLLPEDVDILRELGELYAQVGRWSKVIESLGRVVEIAEGTDEARSALRRIAEIYERELELPDRAIDAYRQLVAQWSDDTSAYAALDRQLGALGRWAELADILRRRAALTRAPEKRAAILRRRASLLVDRLGAPEEGAAALRHARSLTPDAPGLESELVQALIAAGRTREAASLLDTRVDALTRTAKGVPAPGSGVGDLAALLIRLADAQVSAGDKDAAQASLARALTLVPDHPTALAAQARLVEDERDPRAFAEARLREAEDLEDIDAKVAALMDAGLALRDRLDDIEGARAAFEAVLQVLPYQSEATWALAGLVEQGGDPVQAAQVLESRLEDSSLEPAEAARIHTQLAALARQAGVEAAAESHLDGALRAVPGHLPAIIARADLLGEAERFEDLEAFLREALPRLEDAPAATLAELNRRLAVACEHLGRDDEAYQILLAADKLHRGHLMVKLALGENRYRAKRWREAALHLSALAVHVDAPRYPAEVAEGLYHAAQAEIRSLRPEKARPLYERALDLKPKFTPALHALAELAMESGAYERAAELLLRQAEATEEPSERMRLFEALGDMALETLSDEARALSCYQAAVDAASPLEAKHVALLEKLLRRQEAKGDHRGAARTAELMASFGSDGPSRASRYTSAAENYLAVGEPDKALAAARNAVDADPYDLTAVTVLSELLAKRNEHEEITEVLGRALSKSDDADAYIGPRKALLWDRLAHARRARGDIKGATSAWEHALALAGHSDGAMNARRALLEIWKNEADKRDTLLEFRRVLAMDSMSVKDVVTYARDLCRGRHDDGGRAVLELAQTMGHQFSELDRNFLERRPVVEMAPDDAYRGVLSESLRAEVVLDRSDDDDDGSLLGVVLSTIWEAAPVLWPEIAESLLRNGVADATRVTPPSEVAAVNMFPRITSALGAPATMLYASRAADAPDIQIVCAATPIVVFGPKLQQVEDPAQHNALRFLLGRAAEMLRPENIIAVGMPHEDYLNLLGALLRLYGPPHLHDALPSTITDADARHEYDESLRTALPVKLRERLEILLEDASSRDIDPDRYWSALDRAADRAGLLVCGDIATALSYAGATDMQNRRVTRHLTMTALSPGYLEARAALGVGVR
ncbi:tetratricopeptide repeat protein [Haliangium ochraceum]|uniref:Tetratricopeptide TPR_2 repeat protein n=1 Tax=Haliangium ochraceum (strain DSM 14365 / JCM 11303 / SMP-2) TaxID=502025 RepID=D0LKS1_HALO1|nr:tetratricopeptide repeat protein [Haliangium ochraceum]ACY16641.1 Tetratricopeptide TPR_2 repeat protein [Haliangium ochraceum DSM 14365]